MYKHPEKTETTKKYVVKVIECIDRANCMIKDLLDSNRIKSGEKLSIHSAKCNLVTIIKEVCEDLSEVSGDRFLLNSPESLIGQFDEGGIRRALENLLTNAIKYGSPEKVTVTIEQNEGETLLRVHNEGNPIPLKDQAKLFDHYHRAEHVQEGDQQGWGIGLTLVKGIAEAHDGRIEVRSSKNEGTTFSMILPHH